MIPKLFSPADLTVVQTDVLRSIERWSHMYAWVTYSQIRCGIPNGTIASSVAGKVAVLAALDQLTRKGYVEAKGKLWGLAPAYDNYRRLQRY